MTKFILSAILLTISFAGVPSQARQDCSQFTNYQDYMRCQSNNSIREFLGDDDDNVDYVCLIDPRKCY